MKRSLCVMLLVVAVSSADDFWTSKPYAQWSKVEVEKMLRDSPWAKHVTLSQTRGTMALADRTTNIEREQQVTPTITYTAQLRSARPIREAVVRDRQLSEKYDRMPAGDKTALDAKTNAYLAAPQEDVVIYVTYESNVRLYAEQLRRYWTNLTYDQLKNRVTLKLGRDWFNPTGFAATNGAFQLNFARPAELPRSESLVLQFEHPGAGLVGPERIVIEFKFDKMLVDGTPVI